ncbi:alpha/beta fold hydrolase [Pseudacidovorax sp. RU35E]|uniref:alpha/beta fold hydrolase n=1 Tax=Pseudacidovorax sp. RU35E TaxID=1907403 RepID=UPI000953C8A0|nr:alpha/beta hydrolase [Pseudacidovorax sp. RU35E]SIR49104.1 Pimeloyl-ACP methyl ester carboxylesterase [Pseudacidovorax sp. RU35E]
MTSGTARANGIDIAFQDSGSNGPVVLLVMGLGMQLIAWPASLVDALVAAGYRVLRHDNRDAGLSTHLHDAERSNLMWQALRMRMGLTLDVPYGLQDMAGDALGLLDALGIAQAHVLGVSMGGMIVQRMAATAPDRVLSLTSIMSSSGARHLPGPRAEVAAAMLRRPPRRSAGEDALLDHSVGLLRLIQSPAWPLDEAVLREQVRTALRRSYDPAGTQRQLLAIWADTERPALLSRIACPALVVHGEADPLLPVECGRDTARRIPGARFVGIPGMGHDWPPAVAAQLVGHVLPFLQDADARRQSAA